MTKVNTNPRRAAMEMIETRGVMAATVAAIEVCEDKKAPGNARATAAGLLFRASGLGGFGKGEGQDHEKEPHQMTAEEMQERIEWLREQQTLFELDNNGVFE